MPIRLLIADDHALVRDSLRAVMESEPGFVVVGDASDGAAAVTRAVALDAEVVLMNLRMPRMGGIEATRQLRAVAPDIRVLILTTHAGEDEDLLAMAAGAGALVLKVASSGFLIGAVRALHEGTLPCTDDSAPRGLGDNLALAPAIAPLSTPERTLLRLLADGSSIREAAETLHISQATALVHLAHICAVWEVPNLESAIVKATGAGLLH
jgi:DNA-binding NarL/FixJ family response regulator